MMNSLLVGAGDKTQAIKERLKGPYLLIDDGPIIEGLGLKASRFEPKQHSFNILDGMDYQRACDLVTLLNAVFPEGDSTLTRKNSNFELLRTLCNQPTNLEALFQESEDVAIKDAQQKVERLMLSPILKSVFTKRPCFTMNGTIHAHIDRRALRDFDAFVLTHLLIMQYGGQVVIPDFGAYGRPYLSYLIREERLICGVRALAELPYELRQSVLLMDDKYGRQCNADDAETLVSYEGISRIANRYNERIGELTAIS